MVPPLTNGESTDASWMSLSDPSISNKAVFCGDTFRFIIADQKLEREETAFTLYSALVARQSSPLKTLIEGRMREAKEGYAVLNGVDVHTFTRFCEFVYTGDYNSAEPAELGAVLPGTSKVSVGYDDYVQETTGSVKAEADTWVSGSLFTAKKDKKSSKKAQAGLPALSQLHYDKPHLEAPFDIGNTLSGIDDNKNFTKNYTPVLLSHAQLYAFAEQYDVLSLKSLALYKFYCVLTNLRAHHVVHIAPLIEYVYSTTPERTGTAREPLRDLVAHYVACEAERLRGLTEFAMVIDQGGDFVKDLLGKVLLRL